MSARIALTFPPTPARTRAACEAAFALGLTLAPPGASAEPIVCSKTLRLLLSTPRHAITLITGPSGSGKSTLLRAAHAALRADPEARVIRPDITPAQSKRPIADLLARAPHGPLAALSRAGLAEAALLPRTPRELSAGQRARLALCLAMLRADNTRRDHAPATLILDEFASPLDTHSARAVAILLRRFIAQRPNLRAIIATLRDDIEQALAPHRTVTLDALSHITLRTNAPRSGEPEFDLTIEPGALRDLESLAPFHYRSGPPARPALILAARTPGIDAPVGVLAVTHPTLNARWRDLAWPGRFTTGPCRSRAARLNAELRTIARVIVDPRFRALGIAQRLVRAYLDNPLTPLTEAVASLGPGASFFTRAGMTPYPLTPHARHQRLLDALHHAGIEPWRLATPDAALARLTDTTRRALIEREARTWARASRASTHLARTPLTQLLPHAARALTTHQTAFAHASHTP